MTAKLREVDGGKWRRDDKCGCAYLFEKTPDGKRWTQYHVRACNGRDEGGKHRRKGPETMAELPGAVK